MSKGEKRDRFNSPAVATVRFVAQRGLLKPLVWSLVRVTVYGKDQVVEQKCGVDYTPLVREIVKFFQTRTAPVTAAQTLEIYAFMEASDESTRRNGRPVKINEVLEKANCPDRWMVK